MNLGNVSYQEYLGHVVSVYCMFPISELLNN